ncbi:MAG TPA: lysylphosphatidylglycerol synthase transmembrane domain-containing protein [Thermoleophilia bacterium]|nr:lysylphosphatidylglycerol synthase transmembrane domain-containing protein [Thermoleophilia bacterium]
MADDSARATPSTRKPDELKPRRDYVAGRSSGVPTPAGSGEPEPASSPEAERQRSLLSYIPVRQLILFAIAIVGLYFVWPQLVSLFSQVPQLRGISWVWFVLMGLLEAASFACMWGLMRLTLNEKSWFLVGTAQLISNAVSRVIPGGVASGGTASYQLLTIEGAPPERIVSGLTANTLLSTGMLFALPALSLPAVLFGGVTIAHSLVNALTYGMIVFALILVAGAVSLFTNKPLRAVGVALQRIRNRLLRKRAPLTDLPDRLVAERDLIRSMLGKRWWQALPFAAGNWLLDYSALLAALAAVGVRPRASLVLVAYVVAALLGMLPITPGGLGFVEVGLAATLTVAGVAASEATLATLAYRLVSFWMPIPAGGVAYVLYRRHYGSRATNGVREPAHRRAR